MSRLALTVWLSAIAVAQDPVVGPARAEQLVKELELADKCPDAMYELWQLGADSLPALSRAISDPRIEVVESACTVIHEMKEVAAPIQKQLERALKGVTGRREMALAWALRAVTSHTIACAGWQGQLVLLDKSGKVQATHKGFVSLWGVQLLPDGHCLIAQSKVAGVAVVNKDGVVVPHFDDDGKEVNIGPGLRAQRLLNGHTVLADNGGKVRELDRSGEVVWQYDTVGTAVTRLLNGHTLILSNQENKVIELDRSDQRVRQWDVPGLAYGIKRLPNGHTLVTTRSAHRVIEYDGKGKEVKSTSVLSEPNDVLLYADGTMVVGGMNGVSAYDAEGKMLWTHDMPWVGGLAR